ncbi:MAG: ABC transporter ATP-binding protein [Eubacterium sp.]|nr:ABC transporter ATP-binding protein [Eubacterium sp.]MCI8858490.1 ABC transporter ATP-binding protein [Lachnospiraceae bacterium]
MSAILECKNLSKAYGSRTALSQVSLTLEGGHIIGLLGPNGSGKTTFIKLINGLLTPSEGELYIDQNPIGPKSKSVVSYLPDHTYLDNNLRIKELISYFEDFYADFEKDRAYDMLKKLQINPGDKLKTMSKGTKEKVQLILIMSRRAKLYVLDEPIAGVDPAARDYILETILNNYDEDATILISTHLISDIENILDQVIFLKNGQIVLNTSVDNIREQQGKSVDALFREVFKC